MAKQALVVGLGRFGMSLARALVERGAEVLAVDSRPEIVRAASEFVAEAACFDATDPEALARTAPARRDLCVCAIGDDSTESSILVTAMLREAGAPRVVARASGELQARILRRVGAHEVVNPLLDYASRFAARLVHEEILGELPLGRDLLITEMRPPATLHGRTLAEAALPQQHEILVVAIRRAAAEVRLPQPTDVVTPDDVLIVVSRRGAVARFMERG